MPAHRWPEPDPIRPPYDVDPLFIAPIVEPVRRIPMERRPVDTGPRAAFLAGLIAGVVGLLILALLNAVPTPRAADPSSSRPSRGQLPGAPLPASGQAAVISGAPHTTVLDRGGKR